jgi:hypothetical protein
VLPALPSAPRLGRALWAAIGVWPLLLMGGPAWGLDLDLSAPRERRGYLYVDVYVREPFGERVRESLQRGMPATVQLRAELWRRRNGWFDRMESSFEARVRVQYEAWSDRFRIERAGGEAIRVSGLDSAATVLSRPWALPVGRIGDLKPGVRYYVVVHAILKPLSVEDVAEVEGWLSGEMRSGRGAGLGVITELPVSLFDAVRNFAGFGDKRSRTTSEEFELRDLFP